MTRFNIHALSSINVWGVVALVVVVAILAVWIYMLMRANRNPERKRGKESASGRLKRGPVSGGAIRGDPGQNILTGEAPRQEESRKNGPMDL